MTFLTFGIDYFLIGLVLAGLLWPFLILWLVLLQVSVNKRDR